MKYKIIQNDNTQCDMYNCKEPALRKYRYPNGSYAACCFEHISAIKSWVKQEEHEAECDSKRARWDDHQDYGE